MSGLISNLSTVHQQVREYAARTNRDPAKISLVAVTKTHSPEVVEEALRAGLTEIGENKVQEAKAKKEIVGDRGSWHLIGHLQSNKAKLAVRIFDWIESLDSWELAQTLNEAAQHESRHLKVLLQINVSGEGTKFGVPPESAPSLVEKINQLSHLELRGLMTIAPFYVDAEKTRPVFAALRTLRDQLEVQTGLHLPDLSMGMSHDFGIAIEEGATIIRLGSVIFGSRPTKAIPREEI